MNRDVPCKRITDRFVAQAARVPESIAISSATGDLTYRSLHERAISVARRIRSTGESPARRVAVVAERGADFVVAVLASSLGGATFVVIDAAYPDARIEQLLDICRPGLILVAGGACVADRCFAIARDSRVGVMRVQPEQQPEQATADTQHGNAGADDDGLPDQPAYLLFTSGSTGTPKCVAVSHAPLVHFVDWHARRAGVSDADRFSLVSGLSHDPVLRDIFTPLSTGARLVIPPQETIVAPGQLRPWFFERGITIAHLTPSMGRLLSAQSKGAPLLSALRHVFWGGEKLTHDVVQSLARIAPHALQTNFYGCTETPQAICCFDVDPDAADAAIPIGCPVDGFDLFIAGENGEPAACGTPGEICVRSPFLSMGYVSDGELVTSARSGVYHTGDYGTCDADGVFSIVGRRDDQVKVRGFRVDLNEVSAGLLALDGVDWCLSLPFDDANGQRIESFVQTAGGRWDASGLQRALAARLPGYMVPARCHFLPDGPPLLPNGKVDRDALRRIAEQPERKPQAQESVPHSSEEATLIARWADIFPGELLSPRSTFKSLGGDSLSYVEAYLAAEEVLGTLPADWADQPIAQLARLRRPGHSFWVGLDSTIVIRCVAILMIVAYHFHLCPAGDGLTGTFFLISGFVFATLKLPPYLREFRAADSLGAMKRIFMPTLAFALLTCVIDFTLGKGSPVPALLFYANWIDYATLVSHGVRLVRQDVIFWYVDCLLQMIVLVTAAMLAAKWLFDGAIRATRVVVGLLALGLVFRFVVPFVLHPDYLKTGIEELSVYQFSSLGNLPTFVLGMALMQWIRGGRRITAALVAVAYGLADAPLYGIYNGLSMLLTGLCMIYLPTIRVPRFSSGFIRTIASSALFIYLTQMIFAGAAERLLGTEIPVADLLSAVVGGVAVSMLWSRLDRRLSAMGGFVLRMSARRQG